MILSLIFLLLAQTCLSFKFLVYSPLFGHSHTTFMAKLADTLTAAGHEVTFLVPIMDEENIGKKNVSLTKDVIEVKSTPEISKLMKEMHRVCIKQMWEMRPDMIGMLKMATILSNSFGTTCKNLMNQEALLEQLRARKYDVGIVEPFSICGYGKYHYYYALPVLGLFEAVGIPATIGAVSTTQLDIVSWYMGEPLAPSYVPSMSGDDGANMGFLGRAKNLLSTGIGFKLMGGSMGAEWEYIKDKVGSDITHYGDLISKSSFMFTNANAFLNYPRPLIHKTVEIGGITIDAKNLETLNKEWDKVLSERKQNVIISFGSVARSKDMPELWKKSILEMCASLPDVTFIWKYEVKSDMADHIPNLHLSSWLPQNALLADKRLSVFITHGGLGSTTEVAHIGKPAIMIPLFAEQPRNAEMLARQGGAITLHKTDLAKSEVLKKAVETILNNDSYAKEATRLANMLKNQPFTPRDLVVKHAEFVAKFGRLENLEPYGKHLSFIEYYFIDVLALAAFTVAAAISVVFLTSRWVIWKVCGSQKAKKE